MSKYENDPQYEHKFFVAKDSIVQQELDYLQEHGSVAYLNVLNFLSNVTKAAGDNEYLVVNQDEPYADIVWNLIKGEGMSKEKTRGGIKQAITNNTGGTCLETEFRIGERVFIKPYKSEGTVESIWLTRGGLRIEVRYYTDKERKCEYFYPEELEFIKEKKTGF